MNRRQRKKKNKAQLFTIILGSKYIYKTEDGKKICKDIENQLKTSSVVLLPAYLHVEAIIKQQGSRSIEIKQESEAAGK